MSASRYSEAKVYRGRPQRPPSRMFRWMGSTWRYIAVFAAGAALGGLAGGGAALLEQWSLHRAQPAAKPAAAAPVESHAAAATQGVPCPGAGVVPAASGEDGQFKLVDSIADKRPGDVAALIVIGKEAAAAGRAHDAEVAFLMACRVAGQLRDDPVALADAKYELAWHYGNIARDSSGPHHDELTGRARALYGDALRVYTARLGAGHEKAVFAANGLAALQQPPAPAQQQARAEEPAPPTPTSRSNDTRVAGAAAAPRPRAAATAHAPPQQRVHPSFDCARARSVPEKLICADPQLAQLDRELGRLHARAKSVAPDPAAFKRHNDEQWRQREASCRDRACLLAWYAQRRAELVDVIDAQRTTAKAAAD